jgi:glyceraldehyde 3-phosphate dehydrogenase
MAKVKVGINGFGRIGKNFLRVLIEKKAYKDLNIVALNIGPADKKTVAYALKYDTILGTLDKDVSYENGYLICDNIKIKLLAVMDPADAHWGDLDIDWVVECSGQFTTREKALKHIESGAKKVLISAPSKGADVTIIPGVNDDNFDKKTDNLVSLGSCTTNNIVPMLHVLEKKFTIKHASVTTIHAYTNSQELLDNASSYDKIRRSRAAAMNMIPTTTGAGTVADQIIPTLKGKLFAKSVRVPVANVSLVDLVISTEKEVTAESINKAFVDAQNSYLKSVLCVENEPLVSSDYMQNDHSVVIDSLLTEAHGTHAKIWGWYDNEWGYSVRLKDFLVKNI